jgi:hypothetical protein
MALDTLWKGRAACNVSFILASPPQHVKLFLGFERYLQTSSHRVPVWVSLQRRKALCSEKALPSVRRYEASPVGQK